MRNLLLFSIKANEINLCHALRAALLLLPNRFTEHELWLQVAGLSYMGTNLFK